MTAPTGDPRADQAVCELSDQLIQTMKLMMHVHDNAPAPMDGLEASALPLLFMLRRGPMRVSDLAAAVHSDTSTVSRHATNLAARGLVDKVNAASDRRVHLLTITSAGRAALEQAVVARRRWFAQVLADWQGSEVVTFRRLLERFAADIERTVMCAERTG